MALDIFTLPTEGGGFNLNNGKIVNGADKKTWIERYREASEFSIEGLVDAGLKEQMPIGHLVSHPDTDEVMMVEDHQIQSRQGLATTVVTGRSYEAILEGRIVGSNKAWTSPLQTYPPTPYERPAEFAVLQARFVISEHIDPELLIDDNDALPQTNVAIDVAHINATYGPPLWEPEEAELDREPVYDTVLNVLAIDNLGIRTRRPRGLNLHDGLDNRYDPNGLTIQIYAGYDRRKSVQFSHRVGDIKEADYLWSNRIKKTSCLVFSRYFAVMVNGPETGYNRRVMTLDAKDLDEQYDYVVDGAIRARILASMRNRGRAALAKKNAVAMSSVQIDDADHTFRFREHYSLGDYVSVFGEYNATTELQVTEHVEIQDKTGYTSYPTLSEITGGYYVPIGRY